MQVQLLGVLPYTDRPQHAHRQHRGEGFPRSAPAPEPDSRHLHAGHRLARTAGTRQTHPGARSRPRFRCRPHAFGTSAVVHSRSPSRLAPDASCAPFPQCSPPRLIHRSSLRWFRTSPCMSGPGGPTSSPVQHHNQRHDLLHRTLQLCSWRTDLRVLPPPLPARQPKQRHDTGDDQEDQLQPHKPKIISRPRSPRGAEQPATSGASGQVAQVFGTYRTAQGTGLRGRSGRVAEPFAARLVRAQDARVPVR